MGLYDWYTTAKKKLEDGLGEAGNVASQAAGAVGGAFNAGVSRLGSLADQARNNLASTVSNDVNGVKNYFNNDATAGGILKNTFSPSSLSDSLMNAPEYTFANDISWNNPVQKLGAEIVQGTANTFHGVRDYAKEAANQYYGNTPQDTGKLVGLGGKAALNLAGLGFGGSKAASLAKDSLEVPAAKGMAGVGQAMWQGAKSSVAPGALFGGAYGLADSVQNHQSLPEAAANTALSAGSGALFAGGLGGTISGVAPLSKVAVQEGRNIKADLFNLPKSARTITTPVTTETIPAHYVKAGEQPGIVQGLPGEIRTALFPKPAAGEQYGAVRPTFKDTAHQTPGVTRDVMAPVPAQTVTRGGSTVKPFEPTSGLFQFMQRPQAGMSIEDVTRRPTNKNTQEINAINAEKNAKARAELDAMMNARKAQMTGQGEAKPAPVAPMPQPEVKVPQVTPGDTSFTPKDWDLLNKLSAKGDAMNLQEQVLYDTLEQRFNSLPHEESAKYLGAPAVSLKSANTVGEDIAPQYDTFSGIFSNSKAYNPKVKEALLNGDLETLRRELVNRGIMTSGEVDAMTHSTNMSGDEVLQSFKDRLSQENPQLMYGKSVADGLNLKPSTSNIERDLATMKKNGSLGSTANSFLGDQTKPYNAFQQRAYDARSARMQEIAQKLGIPHEVVLIYGKRAAEKMGAQEANMKAGMLRLGYPKDVIEKTDFEQMKLILDRQAPWHSLKEYSDKKAALNTKYLEGIDPGSLNDISAPMTGFRDVNRNFEVAFGDKAPIIKQRLLDKFDAAKGTMIDEQSKLLASLEDNIVNRLGIKKGSPISAAVQKFGEGKMTLDELKTQFPNNWEKVVKADEWFRDSYTKLLGDLNRVREENFPTHPLYPESTKQIPYRDNYYRHFQEMKGIVPALRDLFDTPSGIDPALAGSSEYTKPLSKFLAFAQHRTGDSTTYDAVGGFLDYLRAYGYAKHIDPFIQKFRGVDPELQKKTGGDFHDANRLGLYEELSRKFDPIAQIADTKDPQKISEILQNHGVSAAQADWMSKDLSSLDSTKKITEYITEKTKKNSEDIMSKLVPSAQAETVQNKMNNFLAFLTDFSNDLAGKTNPYDRPFQKISDRKFFRALDLINNRVKANVIAGNIGSTLSQFFNVPQGVAAAGVRNATQAIGDTLLDVIRKDAPINQSTFIKERFFSDFSKFDTGILNNSKKFAFWVTGVGDEIGTKYVWNSLYRKATSEGIVNPVKYADDWTRKMVAGRGIGEVPIIQKAKIIKLIAPFQLEVNNTWYALRDIAKNSPGGITTAKKLLEFSVVAYLMSAAKQQLTGSGTGLNPIQAMMDAYNIAQDDKNGGYLKAAGRIGGEVLSNVQGGGLIADTFLSPTNSKKYLGNADPNRFGSGLGVLGGGILQQDWKNTGINFLSKLALPYGGGQIKKTYEGATALANGFADTKTGGVMTPVSPTSSNIIKGLLFGKGGLNEVQSYYDNNGKPLSQIQGEKFKLLGNDPTYFNSVVSDRVAAQEKKALQDGKKPIDSAVLSDGVFQLSNGNVYVKSLDKEFKTSKEANAALAKDSFANSDKNFQDLGDIVLRKNPDGTVTQMRKDAYTVGLNEGTLTAAKRNKDLTTWKNVAEQQYQTLTKMMDDPNIDPLDKVTIQNKIDTLQAEAKKYAQYGGFTKGTSASGGTSASAAANKALALNDTKLTNAKKKGDYSTWKALSSQQASQLQVIMSDPNKTEAQRTQAENKLLALQSQAATYARQGGFKYIKQTDTTALDMALIRAHSPSSSRPGSIAAQIFHGRPIHKATRSRSRMLALNMR